MPHVYFRTQVQEQALQYQLLRAQLGTGVMVTLGLGPPEVMSLHGDDAALIYIAHTLHVQPECKTGRESSLCRADHH